MLSIRKAAFLFRRSLFRLRRRIRALFQVSNETYDIVTFTTHYWRPHMKLIFFSIAAMLCATLLSVSIPLAANEVATYTGPITNINNNNNNNLAKTADSVFTVTATETNTQHSENNNEINHDGEAKNNIDSAKHKISKEANKDVVQEKVTQMSSNSNSQNTNQEKVKNDTANYASGISSIVGRLSEFLFLRFIPFREHVHYANSIRSNIGKGNREVLKISDAQKENTPITFKEGLICRCVFMAFSVLTYHFISLLAHLSAYYASISIQSTMTESTLRSILQTSHPERIAVVSPVKLAQVIRFCAKTSADTLASMLTDGVSSIFTSVALLLALMYISFRLTFLIGILVTVVQYLYIFAGRNQHLQGAAVSAEESHVQAYLTNALTRSETIFVFGCHSFVLQRFRRKLNDLQSISNWLNVSIHGLAAVSTGSITLIFVVVLGMCNYFHRRGDIALMDIALYFLFLQQFVNRLQQLSRDFSQTRATLGRLSTLRNLLAWYSEPVAFTPIMTTHCIAAGVNEGNENENNAALTSSIPLEKNNNDNTSSSSISNSNIAAIHAPQALNGSMHVKLNEVSDNNNNNDSNNNENEIMMMKKHTGFANRCHQVIQSEGGDAIIALEEVSFEYPQVPAFIAEVSVCSTSKGVPQVGSHDTLNLDNKNNNNNDVIINNCSDANIEKVSVDSNNDANDTRCLSSYNSPGITNRTARVNCNKLVVKCGSSVESNKVANDNNDWCEEVKQTDEHNVSDEPNEIAHFSNRRKLAYTAPIRGIRHMNLSAMPHKITALFGHSGCGKSTCLRLFSGLVTPQLGIVRTHKHVVLLEQSHAIFIGSVAENILLQNLESSEADSNNNVNENKTSSNNNNNNNNSYNNSNNDNKKKTVRRGIKAKIYFVKKFVKVLSWRCYRKWRQILRWRVWRRGEWTKKSNTIDPQIRNRVQRAVLESGCASFLLDPFTAYIENVEHPPFSGGQLQRICLARVFGVNTTCTLVLLDEPTTGLDPQSVELLLATIKNLRDVHHKTVIISTHDNRVAEIADSVIYLPSSK